MLKILVLTLCTTLALAAPPPQSNNSPWNSLKDDPTLARFHGNLLNQTLVPFLSDCYSPTLSDAKLRITCSLYFDGVLQLNGTDYTVQLPEMMKFLSEPSKDADFCKQNHTFPAMNYYKTMPTNFSDLTACTYMCMDFVEIHFVPKPICVLLAWMGDEIKAAHQSTIAKPAELPKTIQSSPPSSKSADTILGILPASADKPIAANATIKTVETIQNVTVTVKPAPVAPQVEENKTELTNKQPASDIAAEKPTNEQQAAPEPAVEAPAGDVPLIPDADNKEQSSQSNPPIGTEITDEETKAKEAAANDKPDSFAIDQQLNEDQQNLNDSEFDDPEDGDEDGDNDVLLQSKLAKGIATADPDQHNSMEIIDSNYLPKTNQVTDPFLEQSGSNFFTYFFFAMFLCIVMYVVYHNKSKILALLLEGRRSDKGRGGRRKHTAAYRKLDSNLEEAITSSASGRITQIIY